jgi:hypothetical protein
MTESEARMSPTCPACGDPKASGPGREIVCWPCFKYRSAPFPLFKYCPHSNFNKWLADARKALAGETSGALSR